MIEFCLRLLADDIPGNASLLCPPGIDARGSLPTWLGLILFVGMVVLACCLYRRENAPLGRLRRVSLALLPTLAGGSLVLLAMRVIVTAEFHAEQERSVVLLIDNSQSMKQRDRRDNEIDRTRAGVAMGTAKTEPNGVDPSRLEMAAQVLMNPTLDVLGGLKKHGPVKPYLFGDKLRGVLENELLVALQGDDPRTALADAIQEILSGKDGELPAAIVVITDGGDNASKISLEEAGRRCASAKVPLHVYGVGVAEGGSLQIKDVGLPEVIFFDDVVKVPVRWSSHGFRQGQVRMTLSLAGKTLVQRDIPVREGDDLREELQFTPTRTAGEREVKADCVITIEHLQDRHYRDTLKRPVQILDGKVRVLMIENSPRWEYKHLQNALLRDRRVLASFILLRGDARLMQAGRPFLPAWPTREQLFGFDLVILGDVPVAELTPDRQRILADFVKEGGGLAVIAGPEHMPAKYVASPLQEMLPVDFLPIAATPETDTRPTSFAFALSKPGERSKMMALADQPETSLATWRDLPELYWHYPVQKLRPGTTSLLVHAGKKVGGEPMPLIASHYFGKGEVLFLGIEETWRWRHNSQEERYLRFWGQAVYQLGMPHLLGNSRRVQAALENSAPVLGQPGAVHARILDADFTPLQAKQVVAQLHALDAKQGLETTELVLHAVPGQPGQFRAPLTNDRPGRFEVKLGQPDSVSLQYRVQLPPRHELADAPLAETELRKLAEISGGKFYREEDLAKLVERVVPQYAQHVYRREFTLVSPAIFGCLILLLAAEWLLRKLSFLS